MTDEDNVRRCTSELALDHPCGVALIATPVSDAWRRREPVLHSPVCDMLAVMSVPHTPAADAFTIPLEWMGA